MKIAVFEIEDWEKESFSPLSAAHDIVFTREPLNNQNAAQYADADIACIFIYSAVTEEVLKGLPNLKMVATRSTGFDHIDMKAARARSIVIANVPSYGEATVAEHVFALLLTISHHMTEAIQRTRSGDFDQRGLQGFDLAGKTIGVVGTGSIGQHVVRVARGFGMRVLGHDLAPDLQLAHTLGFEYATLEDLLGSSDIVTLHVPAHPSTRNMISRGEFSLMKKGSVLINTARGSVVDVEALVEALDSGKLLAAGLDVLPEEPVIKEEAELLRAVLREKHDLKTLLLDHILLRMKNVFVTPHSAFNTKEAILRILVTTIGNIEGFVRKMPANIVGE